VNPSPDTTPDTTDTTTSDKQAGLSVSPENPASVPDSSDSATDSPALVALVLGDLTPGDPSCPDPDCALTTARRLYTLSGHEHHRVWEFIQEAYWRYHNPDHRATARDNARLLAVEVADWLDDEKGIRADNPHWDPLDDLMTLHGCSQAEAYSIIMAARTLRGLPPVKPKPIKEQPAT